MQAIIVKCFGPTDSSPARIKATANAGSIIVSRHDTIEGVELDSLNMDKAMALVAKQLAKKFKWPGVYIGGGLPKGNDMVFVPMGDWDKFEVEKG